MIQSVVLFSFMAILGVTGLSHQAQAQNLNNRQRVNSTLQLQSTAPGEYLTRHFSSFENTVAHVTFGDVSSHALYGLVYEEGNPVLRLNGQLLSATYEYNSWILAQAMVQYEILEILNQYGLNSLPHHFVDYSHWSFIWAMRHWDALGSPNEKDYTKDPDNKNFPLGRQASVSEWDALWKQANLRPFLRELTRRHSSLGFENITLSQYIFNARGKHKEAAIALRKRFDELFINECEKRTPGQCSHHLR